MPTNRGHSLGSHACKPSAGSTEGVPVFVQVPAPTDEALRAVLHKIITRMMKLLTRRGALVEEQGATYMADGDSDSDDARTLRRPRLHLIRFHGVLGPNADLRAMVVPSGPAERAEAAHPAACEPNCAHHGPVRLSWARLLKRVFELDLEHCPNCGGELKIIAAILETPVIEKILTHLGLQARAPPRAPARGQALHKWPDFGSSFAFRRPGDGAEGADRVWRFLGRAKAP